MLNRYQLSFTLEYTKTCCDCKITLNPGDVRYICSECNDLNFCEKCYFKTYSERFHTDSAPLPHHCTKEIKTEDQHYQDNKADTVYQCFRNSFNSFKDRKCLGVRSQESISEQNPQGLGDYKWINYQEVYETSERLGTALSKIIPRESMVPIILKNTPEWYYIEFACLFYGYTNIPIKQYINLEEISNALLPTVYLVFVSKSTFPKFIDSLNVNQNNSLKYVIHIEDDFDVELRNRLPENIQLKLFSDLLNSVPYQDVLPHTPLKDGILTLGASSGSTGKPKTLVCKDRDVVTSLLDCKYGYPFITLSYLSLSHVQRRSDLKTLYNGGRIGIFSSELDYLYNDIKLLRPTAFWGVPRIWNIIHGKYHTELESYKSNNPDLTSEQCTEAINTKFKNLFGDRIDSLVTCASLIPHDVFAFMKEMWGVEKVFNLYGSMESMFITVNDQFIPGIQYKLVPVPSMEIDSDFKVGELMVKSDRNIVGFYQNKEATEQQFEDGWFKLGDIVEEYEPGKIRVIDRIKNAFKISTGKFVTPESIEINYYRSPMIKHIFIHGFLGSNHLAAIVVPSESILNNLKLNYTDDLDLELKLKQLIMDDIQSISKEKSMYAYEIPKMIKLDNTVWTMDNNCMNSSGKINRIYLKEYYKKDFEELFKRFDSKCESNLF